MLKATLDQCLLDNPNATAQAILQHLPCPPNNLSSIQKALLDRIEKCCQSPDVHWRTILSIFDKMHDEKSAYGLLQKTINPFSLFSLGESHTFLQAAKSLYLGFEKKYAADSNAKLTMTPEEKEKAYELFAYWRDNIMEETDTDEDRPHNTPNPH